MTYVRGWNPENCPIIPLFLILCNNFMAIFAKLYFSFSEAPINRMEKLSVVQNATKSMSCFFFFFYHPDDYSFSGKKKKQKQNHEYLFNVIFCSILAHCSSFRIFQQCF